MSFKAPPEADFQAYAKLVDAQRSHYPKLAGYGATQCSNGAGLDGLPYPLRGPIATVGTYFHNKFELCASGVAVIDDHETTLTEPASAETDTPKNISLELKLDAQREIAGEIGRRLKAGDSADDVKSLIGDLAYTATVGQRRRDQQWEAGR